MRGKEGVCVDDFGTDCTLDGRFDFGLRACGDAVDRYELAGG